MSLFGRESTISVNALLMSVSICLIPSLSSGWNNSSFLSWSPNASRILVYLFSGELLLRDSCDKALDNLLYFDNKLSPFL